MQLVVSFVDARSPRAFSEGPQSRDAIRTLQAVGIDSFRYVCVGRIPGKRPGIGFALRETRGPAGAWGRNPAAAQSQKGLDGETSRTAYRLRLTLSHRRRLLRSQE